MEGVPTKSTKNGMTLFCVCPNAYWVGVCIYTYPGNLLYNGIRVLGTNYKSSHFFFHTLQNVHRHFEVCFFASVNFKKDGFSVNLCTFFYLLFFCAGSNLKTCFVQIRPLLFCPIKMSKLHKTINFLTK